jgi:hypothetical protein
MMSTKPATTQALAVVIAVIVIAGVGVGAYFLVTSVPAPPPKTSIVVGWTETDTVSGNSILTPIYDMYYRWVIEDYNATGGLYVPEYGKKLPFATPVIYDDRGDINTMLTEYRRLITVDHVDLLFSPISTALNYAVFPLCEQYKMPIIALTFGSDLAGAKMRSGEFSYAFSVLGFPHECADQLVQLFKYINTTADPGQLNKVGILADSDQHGVEYGAAIDADLVLNGFSVPVFDHYPLWPASGPAAFFPMITDLNSSKVDVVIICGYEGGLYEIAAGIVHYQPKLVVCGPGMETGYWVYGSTWGFTPSQVNGVMLYDGWPATAYKTGNLSTWATTHYTRSATTPAYLHPATSSWWPFPGSAPFYAGLQCLFEAVQLVGLNGTKIRDALKADNFTTIVGQTHLRQGESMQCELAGTLNQWQGGNMCEVVWPQSAASASVIYPMPQYGH